MEKVFDGFGIEIYADGVRRYLRFDDGGIVSHYTIMEVTQEEALLAQKSAEDAYRVIIKYQNIAIEHS